MKRRLLIISASLVLLLSVSCGSKHERMPPPPAYEPDPVFRRLAIVNGEPYADMYFKHFGVNPTIDTEEENISTFAVDVDTASYSVARAYLERGQLPDEAAVRVEEFVNKFDYAYELPDEEAFSVQVEASPSPSRRGYHLLHIGLKGREVPDADRKAANLVFVIDVSGSMDMEDRLGLLKRALALLVGELREGDSVGIVVYGDDAHAILESTPATPAGKEAILRAIQKLHPEGSTNAQAGLKLGYEMAAKRYDEGRVNRVILCSDGVANNGITGADAIFQTIQREAERGVTISTVGFGMGNYNDVLMERLADVGNGNYSYVDRLREARRIFVEELTGTLQVIAMDVKIQVEFDKDKVSRYRLLGFENRMLEEEDFADDAVDAGEIGAGHTVTALYEVKLEEAAREGGSFATVRVRHKEPGAEVSSLIEREVPFSIVRPDYASASPPAKLSVVAAAFAEKLRGSYWVRNLDYEGILALWNEIPPPLRDREEVKELQGLIERARTLDRRGDKFESDLPVTSMDFDRLPVLKQP
jgi:Ca-activated chloride channel family protein